MHQSSVDEIVAENIRRALEQSGRSAYSVATALNHAPNWLYRVLNGKAGILLPTLREVAAELGVSVGSLVDPPPETRRVPYIADEALPQLAVSAEPTETRGARCVGVWDAETAVGDGSSFDRAAAVGCLAFRRRWLERHGLDPAQCAVISVRGESMEPTLPEGCSILIDRAQLRRRVGRIFAVRAESRLLVKRAGKGNDGRWRLVSDHPAWSPIPWPDDAKIVGEVRWAARMLSSPSSAQSTPRHRRPGTRESGAGASGRSVRPPREVSQSPCACGGAQASPA